MRQWHLKPSITCALPHKINYYDFSITSQNTSKWLRRIPPSGKSRIKPKRKTIKELEEIDWNFCVKIFCHKGVKFFQDNRKMLEGCNTCMKDLNFLSCVMCPLSQPVYLTVQNDDLTVYTIWHNGRDWIIGLFNTAWQNSTWNGIVRKRYEWWINIEDLINHFSKPWFQSHWFILLLTSTHTAIRSTVCLVKSCL